MTLAELRRALSRYGISLTATPEGKLRPRADQPPPREVIEAMREHRSHLLRQVEEGRLPDGRLDVPALARSSGHCGSCTRWQGPDAYGDGLCPLGRAAHGWRDGNPEAQVLTPAHHRCGANGGEGWKG